MKKQTSYLVLLVLLVAKAVFGANVYWTGAVDALWSKPENWQGAGSSRPLPTNDGMFFCSEKFDSRFSDNFVIVDGAYTNEYYTWIYNVGSEEAPLVFRATAKECGLRFTGQDKNFYIANDESTGDAFLSFESGEWSCNYLKIGTTDHKGYLNLSGATFLVLQDFSANNCTLSGDGTGQMVISGYFLVGSSSYAGEASVEIKGCEVVNESQYLSVGDNNPGKVTVKEGGIYTCKQNIIVGNSSHGILEIDDGGKVDLGRQIYLGNKSGSLAEVIVKKGGILKVADSIFVGERSAAAITVDGGLCDIGYYVYFCHTSDCVEGNNCSITVENDGVFATRKVTCGSGSANALFTFNGGTIRAKEAGTLIDNSENMTVTVSPLGGAIDTAGYTVKIHKEITGEGSLAFVGRGVVELNVLPSCRGRMSVELGTTLQLPAAVDGAKLQFTIPSVFEDGEYTLVKLSGGATFDSEILRDISISTPERVKAEYFLSGDLKEIRCRCRNLPSGFRLIVR